MKKEWLLRRQPMADGRSFRETGTALGVSPVIARCLCNRGLQTEEEMRHFLYATLDDLYDPMRMKGIPEAVGILMDGLASETSSPAAPDLTSRSADEKPAAPDGLASETSRPDIAVATDYDCDGICSGVILKKALERVGFQVFLFTPDRIAEGYGLNRRIVDDAVAAGCRLLITCDNGIAAVDAVAYAREQGMTVIVTDHHEPQEELPAADVIVDPKQEGETYPYAGLCGAGVVYKLITALYRRMAKDVSDVRASGSRDEMADGASAQVRTTHPERDYLPLAAIATVTDVMELRDENRILVKYGLEMLAEKYGKSTVETPDAAATSLTCQSADDLHGLRALLRVLDLEDKPVRVGDIAFRLGPILNATGRIASVEEAFALLLAEDETTASQLAGKLFEINQERKALTDQGTKRGLDLVLDEFPEADREDESAAGAMDNVLVLYLPGVHESLVGLIAGKIKERFNHPAIVFTDGTSGEDGEERLKGSGRSIAPYHMFDHLMKCKDLTTAFGGHAMAAGLTIPKENLDELRRRLNEDSGLTPEDFVVKLPIDVEMPISYLTERFIDDLDRMAPFGVANPKPLFAEKNLRVLRVQYMGDENQHLKLFVENDKGTRLEAVAFFRAEEFNSYIAEHSGSEEIARMRSSHSTIRIALAYQPGINEWNGNRSIQLSIVEWR